MFMREEDPISRKKEERKEVPHSVLILGGIEKRKYSAIPLPRKRHFLAPEKKFDIFLETCCSPIRVGEILRREGIYHTDLARIRATVEEGGFSFSSWGSTRAETETSGPSGGQ